MLQTLKEVSTFIFDVDGVLTDGSVVFTEQGDPSRKFHARDGYALQLAIRCGYNVCIISGSRSQGVLRRLSYLGIQDVFLGCTTKTDYLQLYMKQKNIFREHILYMGDDIPDLEVMKMIGFPACPADAVEEIKSISKYVSPIPGGKGCVRDIIEKVLKIQSNWLSKHAMSW